MCPQPFQVFLVDLRATKKKIKEAVHSLYEIQCKKVNTLIRYVHCDTIQKLLPSMAISLQQLLLVTFETCTPMCVSK